MQRVARAWTPIFLMVGLMLGVGFAAVVNSPATVGNTASSGISSVAGPASVSASAGPAATTPAPSASPTAPGFCSELETVNNDPDYAQFVNHVNSFSRDASSDGLRNAGALLPYTGSIPDQTVNGVAMAGSQLSSECAQGLEATSQTDPTGVAYDGQSDVSGIVDQRLDANSVAGILNVNSQTENFYPGSGTPTQWGAQENVVLPNVTILGSRCPKAPCSAVGTGVYAFWVQNVISYDSFNDTISFVDDTWNFTSGSSEMFSSSLASWSPDGGNYTGVWVAFSPYFYAPPPFTAVAYVNTSVNSAGDQVLWYNYSVSSQGHPVASGTYDDLVFNSQPLTGGPIALSPPDFEASAVSHHEVTEGYEFDAFIGADDGSNNLMLNENASMQVQYCVQVPYCTPSNFSYANVPAAVDFGSQTGEQTAGVGVTFNGSTAYLSPGPLVTHGLWNYSGQTGVAAGGTPVTNLISVSGDPEGTLTAQPYVFVFLEDTAYASQGFQWAPDQPVWYLMPGTYDYQVMLADYTQQNGTLVVGSSPTSLSAVLPYNPLMGVYTPLWAFNNGELAGISSSGSGSVASQYVPFNNPTTSYFGFTPGNLSANFYSLDDYHFPTFSGVLFDGTSAYVDLNAPPSFGVHTSTSRGVSTFYYLGIEFFETSNVTLSHATAIRGWPNWEEISFYVSVPASQNPAPQAEVFVWNSTHDLILSNTFVGTAPGSGYVAPDALVLYGGTDNVVWGNTFRDPYGVAMGSTYAGLGLAEAGDTIYNNNFSVDNPVVYLPYNWDNVADCLPQSLGGCGYNQNDNGWYYNTLANNVGETWNVTPQSSSDVVNTVNGFALSGNVLGPSVATQGGNYFWNYGTSPNNRSTSPYVSRFYYSEWSEVFPLGCGSMQAPGAPCGTAPAVVGAYQDGITAGGDYAPYGPTVTFTETGLPAGASWQVVVGGIPYATTNATLSVPEAYGTYAYSVTAIPGYTQSVTSGTVLASGVPTIAVVFQQVTYAVAFSATGLPSGAAWYVNITAGPELSGTGPSGTVTTALPNGTFAYTVATADGGTFDGAVVVNDGPVTVALAFEKATFRETGLPGGTLWAVTANGVAQASTGPTVVYYLLNGGYAYAVGIVSGYHTVAAGTFSVVGGPLTVHVPFKPSTYTVEFRESGFTAGWSTTWCVTFHGGTECATGASTILFKGVANGTYPYTIGAVANYTLTGGAYTGTETVAGAGPGTVAAVVALHWTLVKYAVTFAESGLPRGTTWEVSVDGMAKARSTGELHFTLSNGTYAFTAYAGGYSNVTGYVTVDGGSVLVTVTFA